MKNFQRVVKRDISAITYGSVFERRDPVSASNGLARRPFASGDHGVEPAPSSYQRVRIPHREAPRRHTLSVGSISRSSSR